MTGVTDPAGREAWHFQKVTPVPVSAPGGGRIRHAQLEKVTCRLGYLHVQIGKVTPLFRWHRGDEWQPRMDSHHQPPESESGVPLIELRGYKDGKMKMEPAAGVAPA